VSATEGPLLAGAALLFASAIGKLRRPRPAAEAMTVLGLPASALLARLLGVVEVAVAVGAVATGGRVAAGALTALYLGFAVVGALTLRRGDPSASCGCTGRDDTPVTPAHVLISLGFAAAGVAAVVRPPGVPAGPLGTELLVAVFGVVAAWLGWLGITGLPALRQAAERGGVA
jgi:hypothetical protein